LPADALIINTPPTTFAINKTAVWLGVAFALLCTLGLIGMTLNIRKRRRLEEMLHLQIDQHQKAQEELQVTEEMLRAQVDDYMQSQDELHATEEALRVQLNVVEESSQKFKAVFEHSPITVALTTLPEGTFSEVNQTFVDMFGYAREEAIGKTTLELGVWQHESDRLKFLQRLKEQRFVHNFEVEMRRKNGEVITVLFSGVLLEMSDKLTVLSAIMEISEQKRLQNQLYQTQKMDVVGQLAGGIAHDFNNMLAGIMAASELLKRRLPGDDKNHKLVDTIMEAAVRSADLTRELLTFARKGTALTAPVKIHGIITAVIALLERTIDKQILLVARLEADNPIVLGDQTLLQNALLNLGVNARDAMPQGGTLTFTTSEKVLDETACRSIGLDLSPGRYLEIVVSDTGIGMATEVMEHIFEPFFTTKAIGKGTGLGLASVYGAVKNHSGDIVVRSQSGIGSIFTLYLPLAGEELHQQPVAAEIVTGSGGILLVDDEEILRDLGRELLENMGYTVYVAADGLQALDVFETHRSEIKLVILDMIMPKLGGKDTFLRLHAQSPDVKVLFCSGFSHEGTGAELVGLGANGFIQKPYTRIQLSQAVADVLGAP
jgi:PAS domain S-box-containing protein